AAPSVEDGERDQAGDERAGDPHGRGLEDAHRIAAWQEQPRERADDQAGDEQDDEVGDQGHGHPESRDRALAPYPTRPGPISLAPELSGTPPVRAAGVRERVERPVVA